MITSFITTLTGSCNYKRTFRQCVRASDHKRLGVVEKHCRKMKTLAPAIIEANGLTGQVIPTPYYNEDHTSIIAVG